MKHANGSFAPAPPPTALFIARVYGHLPPTKARSLLRRHFQIIWHPISHAAVNWPIALCDSRSVDFEKDSEPAQHPSWGGGNILAGIGSVPNTHLKGKNNAHKELWRPSCLWEVRPWLS
ncbi:hypothetical protein EV424DRAFT_1320438 [Suillus variegatus]|nr:hypothetical protein EV424DRAFT_1320438 [Suillus variegatus]